MILSNISMYEISRNNIRKRSDSYSHEMAVMLIWKFVSRRKQGYRIFESTNNSVRTVLLMIMITSSCLKSIITKSNSPSFQYFHECKNLPNKFGRFLFLWKIKQNLLEFQKLSDTLKRILNKNKNTSMKQFHSLITNTTSLVGYIAVLMFVGAYFGGGQGSLIDPALLKGNIIESRDTPWRVSTDTSTHSAIITIDGRQYQAMIGGEVSQKPEFQY